MYVCLFVLRFFGLGWIVCCDEESRLSITHLMIQLQQISWEEKTWSEIRPITRSENRCVIITSAVERKMNKRSLHKARLATRRKNTHKRFDTDQ